MIVELLSNQISANVNKNMQLTSLEKIMDNCQIDFNKNETIFDFDENDFEFEG